MNVTNLFEATPYKNTGKLGIRQWFYCCLQIFDKTTKFKQLLEKALIAMLFGFFNGTFAGYEQLLFKQYGCDTLRYIICRAKLPWETFRDLYNLWAVSFIKKIALKYEVPISASIDDMLEQKDPRSKDILKGGKRKKIVGFSFVTCVLSAGHIAIPLIPRIAIRKEVCNALKMKYKSKVAIGIEFVKSFSALGLKGMELTVLLDSWYTSADMLKTISENGFETVSAIKKNRKVNRFSIEDFRKVIRRKQRTKKDAGEYTYYLTLQKGTLSGLKKEYVVLLSKRVRKKDKRETWRYILSSNVNMKAAEILSVYSRRWVVETFHQIWQHRFGIKNWQVKGKERQRNLMIITVMAMGFAVYYAVKKLNEDQIKILACQNRSIMSEGLELVRTALILQQGGVLLQCSKFI